MDGPTNCPRRHSGNLPPGRILPSYPWAMTLILPMLITIGMEIQMMGLISNIRDVGQYAANPWAFDMQEMYGNG